jgi:hypothetical protein
MNDDSAIYVKIDKIIYKGKEVFYRKPINIEMHLATEFSKNYEYFYKEKEDEDEKIKYLGKFIEFGMYGGNPYWDNYDYPIIKFEKDNVFENKKQYIYSRGIPDSADNMVIMEDIEYEGFPVYYEKYNRN